MHFDQTSGDPIDSSGKGNNGFLENTHGDEWTTAGKVGGALSLKNGAFVEVDSNETIEPKDLTIEAWIKPAVVTGTSVILAHGSTGGPGCEGYFLFLRDGAISFIFGGLNPYSVNSTTVLKKDTWYHIAASYSSASTIMSLYVNGKLEATWKGESYKAPSILPLRIGTYSNGLADYYNGLIDELRISNKARTADELLFNGGQSQGGMRALQPPSPGLAEGGPLMAPWDRQAKLLLKAPKVFNLGKIEKMEFPGVRSIFYEGLPWQGKENRVFAYLGLPPGAAPDHKVPAVVLIPGGSGAANKDWVRCWTKRGYAAITFDNSGSMPEYEVHRWMKYGYADITFDRTKVQVRHEWGGPPSADDSFQQMDWSVEDQWQYQAIAYAILANSLLRNLPEVDPERIAVHGLSWGGYLTCIAAAADSRFKLAVVTYGCGFINEDTVFSAAVNNLPKEKSAKWLKWDPRYWLPNIRMPMFWVTGSNDSCYYLSGFQKSYRLPKGERSLCIRVRMGHGEGDTWATEEIYAYADSKLKGATPLALITGQGRDGTDAWVSFEATSPVVKAEFNYTKDQGKWPDRQWQIQEARLDPAVRKASAPVPEGTTAYYFNLTDERKYLVSSEHVDLITH